MLYLINMKTNSLLALVMLISVILAVVLRYMEYKVNNDFVIFAHTTCIDNDTSCFIAKCEDTDCVNSPYKKVRIKSNDAPICLIEHNCEAFDCNDYYNCHTIHCSDDTLESGEVCYTQ